ncbi:hypothetical protein GCM10018785_35710 [Streptomyces longispororuber]|uniref:WD40 repeat protein n=1 Tax=Streptomyces longispororuber TaxID=68230 RepID=A0A919DPS5_9ACTN|nr:hypothetical protein [Streptomyces longispororuber]GHE63686.1 hypothetical protein GCM10018785_35710 [Streptomyces longispororuber]
MHLRRRAGARGTAVSAVAVTAVAALTGASFAAPAEPGPKPRIERVSVTADGKQGQGASTQADLSADGSVVVFSSTAKNFGPLSHEKKPELYVKDLRNGKLTQVHARDAGAPKGSWTGESSLSADGSRLAFAAVSQVDGGQGVKGEVGEVYVRDLRSGRTEKVNVGVPEDYRVVGRKPSISADGRHVAFLADHRPWWPEYGAGTTRVYVRDLKEGVTQRVSIYPPDYRQADSPVISADGGVVAYELHSGGHSGPPFRDLYVTDRTTGRTEKVDVPHHGHSANASNVTDISPDGNSVVFQTWADNLVPDDTNDETDVFVRDWRQKRTWRQEATALGEAATGGRFSADGRHLLFHDGSDVSVRNLRTGKVHTVLRGLAVLDNFTSDADTRRLVFTSSRSDLVPGDTNQASDVFLLRR